MGNEIADYRAGLGCGMQEKLWDRETYPLALHQRGTGEQISPHGWNAAATKQATEYYGTWARELLRGEGQVLVA